MKTEYIDALYNDFNTKFETVQKYLALLGDDTTETTKFLAEYVKLHEALYTALEQNKRKNTIPPDSQFAIEKRDSEVVQDQNPINVKEISDKIQKFAPMLEYKFEIILKNLQFTTQAFQNYQTMTSKIIEAWSAEIEKAQS